MLLSLRRSVPVVLLLALLAFLQYSFDLARIQSPMRPISTLSPSVIRAIDFGLHTAASSLAWLNTIQHLQPFLLHEIPVSENLRLVIELDPLFSYAYAFGILILPAAGDVTGAIAIGELGLRETPHDWRIPYYLGTIIHMQRGDRAHAALLLDRAARTPGAPPGIRVAAARYGTSDDHRSAMKVIWQSIADTSDDMIVRDQARAYVGHLEVREILEQAIDSYQKKFGKHPLALEDLVRARLLASIPDDPLGLQFEINADGTLDIKPQ